MFKLFIRLENNGAVARLAMERTTPLGGTEPDVSVGFVVEDDGEEVTMNNDESIAALEVFSESVCDGLYMFVQSLKDDAAPTIILPDEKQMTLF